MNLKDFLATRDKPPELYWSLVLEKGWVQAGIWYIGDSAAEVIAVSPPAAWEEDEELIGACDAALSSAVAKLPENYEEPGKTVFGVPSLWVKSGEIQDEYLAKIKSVCTDLSLTPVGFVVLPEAIAHLFKSEEGTPLSAVVIGLGTEELEVSVFKLGNLAGTTNVSRSVSLIDDVAEGLSRFEGVSPLPSRIIVYDGKGGELEDAKGELMSADWEGKEREGLTKIKFLHTPKAEILVSDKKVLATCLAGAAEIGDISQVKATEDKVEVEESLPPREEVENVVPPPDETTAEDLGFVVNEDISNVSPRTEPSVPSPFNPPAHHAPAQSKPHLDPGKYLQKTKSLFHGFSSKIKIQSPKISSGGGKRPVYFLLVLLALILVGGGIYLWFVPKATVTVYVSPKTYQQEVGLTFNTNGQFDSSKAIVPGVLISSTATGEKTKSTTGSKLVGEKAKGSVQIANGNGNSIKVVAGTVITSASGLRFLTDSEASISGQLIPGSPGTATLGVTAADIGAQYNLAKGEVFKVGVFDKSQVAATSQSDFSGGSSQQIAAVSADDQKSLEDDLKTELSDQVLEELESQVTPEQIFVNDLSSLSIDTADYDKKVGDVAETLKLTLTVKADGIAADREKLLSYTADSLKSKIPQGFALRNSQIAFKFTFAGKESENLKYNADIKANFLPMVNSDELISKISGKSTKVVEEYLTTVPGYVRAEIKQKPNLPGPFGALPRVKKNITIEVASDQ